MKCADGCSEGGCFAGCRRPSSEDSRLSGDDVQASDDGRAAWDASAGAVVDRGCMRGARGRALIDWEGGAKQGQTQSELCSCRLCERELWLQRAPIQPSSRPAQTLFPTLPRPSRCPRRPPPRPQRHDVRRRAQKVHHLLRRALGHRPPRPQQHRPQQGRVPVHLPLPAMLRPPHTLDARARLFSLLLSLSQP